MPSYRPNQHVRVSRDAPQLVTGSGEGQNLTNRVERSPIKQAALRALRVRLRGGAAQTRALASEELMGEIVNKIAEAAFVWQRPIAWIRINIGYMLVEITDLAKQGESVTDIEDLLSKFNDKFAIFSQAELSVFMAAREAEVDKSLVPNLNTALEVMVKSFSPWLDEYHNLVTKRRKDPPDRTLVLLHSCGGEIFNAHKTFVDIVNDYRDRNAIG